MAGEAPGAPSGGALLFHSSPAAPSVDPEASSDRRDLLHFPACTCVRSNGERCTSRVVDTSLFYVAVLSVLAVCRL